MDAELAARQDGCTRFLGGHGPVRAADLLATIPTDTAVDRYGDGGVVAALEAEIASLLGKPAAVFLPSGTMAQQAVLRVHADRRGRRTIVFHPMCHLEQREGQGYRRLQMLAGRQAGDPNLLLKTEDLAGIAEPAAALLLELPQRDIGGQQPAWEDLAAQSDWARSAGAAVHLDGARLWESAAGYGRSPAEVAALIEVPGVRVVPDPPQTPMMHLLLATTAERFAATARGLAAEQELWTWPGAMTTADRRLQRVELAVGDATCSLSATEVAAAVAAFAAG